MVKRPALKGVSALVMSLCLLGGAGAPANAQDLFEMLFGNQRHQRQRQQQAPAPAPAPLPKISSPSYHDYRPDSLMKVGFSTLAAAKPAEDEAADQPAAGDAADEPSLFERALPGLADFELFAEKEVAAALLDHYAETPQLIWVDERGPNARADAVLRVLGEADNFGLDDADYLVTVPAAAPAPDAGDDRLKSLIRFEMTLSARVLRYARDAHLGRLNPNKLSGYHDLPQKTLVGPLVLRVLAQVDDPAEYLESLHPQNTLYAALKQELAVLRKSAENEIIVDPDMLVRPGGQHPDFPKILRLIERDSDAAFLAEHGAALAAQAGSDSYGQDLVPVIKAAQEMHGLKPDGVIGRRTVAALAGETKAARIDKVLLTMERLRWHPSHLGDTRVMINVPSFTASYIEDGVEELSMRAVVGSRSNQTSFFFDEIEFVEFNPYWGVPRSILINEKLPRLRQDPSYLDRTGYEVTDARGRRVSSSSIDWSRYGANIPFNVRQPPGPRNALGELKIMFPNKHDIYMHDTPEKALFSRDTRAFSHGCVRLQDPRAMAAAVLRTTEEEVGKKIAGGGNMRQDVPKKIPVYVGYFTAWPQASGEVTFHDDVYGRDAHLKKSLAKVSQLRAPGS